MKLNVLKQKISEVKKQTLTLYFVSRDPKLPLYLKIIAIIIVSYAISPIDLIPDFIPILGLLDDFIIIPLGLALLVYLTPAEIIEAAKLKALSSSEKPISYMAASIIIIIWIIALWFSIQWLVEIFN